MRRLAIVIAVTFGLFAADRVEAAEIKALISTAMKAPFEEIVAQFEKASGHKVVAAFGPTGPLTKRIADSETADMVILGGENTSTLIGQGKIKADSKADVARGMIGAGVAKG